MKDVTFTSAVIAAIMSATAAVFVYFDQGQFFTEGSPLWVMVLSFLTSSFAAFSRRRNAVSAKTSNTADVNPLTI